MKPISGLLNALSKASTADSELHRHVMLELSNLANLQLKHDRVKEMSIVLNALARRNVYNPKLFQRAGNMLVASNKKNGGTPPMNSQDLANVANAFAKVEHRHPALFRLIGNAAIPIIHDFTPQGLANLVNAFAKLNHQPADRLFDAVADAAVRQLTASSSKNSSNAFTAQGLANIANAFAKMNHHSATTDELFELIAKISIPKIHTFNPQNLGNTANAFAKMEKNHDALLRSIGNEAISKMRRFNEQELSNLVNAFARLKRDHPRLFEEVAHAATPLLPKFKAQELSMLVNAFVKMDQDQPKLWHGVANAAVAILPTFQRKELAVLANAVAKSKYHDQKLFDSIAVTAKTILSRLPPPSENGDGGEATLYISMLANAFAKVSYQDDELFDLIARTALPHISDCKPHELANLISATAKSRAKGDSVDLLFTATANFLLQEPKVLSQWPEQNLIELAYAFLKARRTNPELLHLIAMELLFSPNRRNEELDARGLGNFAAALSRQEMDSSAMALKRVFALCQALPHDEIELQTAADMCKALWLGQKLKVVGPDFCLKMADLAIEKATEASAADVRDILLTMGNPQKLRQLLKQSKRKELLLAYKSLFEDFSKQQKIAPKHVQTIREFYEAFDIDDGKE